MLKTILHLIIFGLVFGPKTVLAEENSSAVKPLHILFYYSSGSPEKDLMVECANILKNAGSVVKVVDVGLRSYDPAQDDWRGYDQVWDARVVDYNPQYGCTGLETSPDYFGPSWQTKAADYLNRYGKLCLIGECCHFVNRGQGLYEFLPRIQAVKPGFSTCAPSPDGSNETDGQIFFPVVNGLGPVSFYSGWAGGIPLNLLTGTNFVDTKEHWKFGVSVDRSVVSGWTGDQLGGLVKGPSCVRGKLFIVWDTQPWVWPHWVSEGDPDKAEIAEESKQLTLAIAKWLGNGNAPCETPTPSYSITSHTKVFLTPTISLITTGKGLFTATSKSWPTRTPTHQDLQIKSIPTVTPLLIRQNISVNPNVLKTNLPPLTEVPPLDRGQTIVFTAPPANIYVTFADGSGRYQVEVVDGNGNSLEAIYDHKIISQSDTWLEWDGLDTNGKDVPPGRYFVILSKDGKALKRISVIRNEPLPK